ncbi:MAG: nuclease-related domain-containing protein [Phototrophicaceae bacterium]|jgi:hypothetical protein
MRIEINERVIKRNRQIAQYTFFASLGIWLAGLGVTLLPLFQGTDPETLGWLEFVPTIILPVGLLLALFAVYMTNLWIREPRPEQAIREGLKGISNKTVLYHYYHTPAKHLLITPQGIFVLVVRFQTGMIEVKHDRWRLRRGIFERLSGLFRLDGLGDPVGEAKRGVEYIQRILKPIAPNAEVQAVIILTDPRAEVTIEESSLPILYADEKGKPSLKNYLRGINRSGDMPLTPEQIKAFEEVTLPAPDAK